MPNLSRSLLALSALAFVAACTQQSQPPPAAAPSPEAQHASRVERGQYLVNAMGCDDCHTPFTMTPQGPAPDMSRRLMGHPQDIAVGPQPKLPDPWIWAGTATNTAFAGPWGISFAANLTSDPNTGVGQDLWTEDLFLRAIREGKHMGTDRPILPPMPWPVFRNLNDEDLKSIFAYLRTVAPIRNQVPDPVIAAPPPDAK